MRRVARRPSEGVALEMPPRPPFLDIDDSVLTRFTLNLMLLLKEFFESSQEEFADLLHHCGLTFTIPGMRYLNADGTVWFWVEEQTLPDDHTAQWVALYTAAMASDEEKGRWLLPMVPWGRLLEVTPKNFKIYLDQVNGTLQFLAAQYGM